MYTATALAYIIFSAFAASTPVVGDQRLSAVTIVWNYVRWLVFYALMSASGDAE